MFATQFASHLAVDKTTLTNINPWIIIVVDYNRVIIIRFWIIINPVIDYYNSVID